MSRNREWLKEVASVSLPQIAPDAAAGALEWWILSDVAARRYDDWLTVVTKGGRRD